MRSAYYHLGGKNNAGVIETPYLAAKVPFLIRCAACHNGLCKLMEIGKDGRDSMNLILVEPCPRCLEAARAGVAVEPVTLPERDAQYWGLA